MSYFFESTTCCGGVGIDNNHDDIVGWNLEDILRSKTYKLQCSNHSGCLHHSMAEFFEGQG